MKDRVRFFLVASPADLTAVLTALSTDFDAQPKWSTDYPVSITSVDINNSVQGVMGEARFLTPADALSFYDLVVSRWTSGAIANRVLVGSYVELHSCNHDDGPGIGSCAITQRTVK